MQIDPLAFTQDLFKQFFDVKFIVALIILIFIATTGYLVYTLWRRNNHLDNQLATLSSRQTYHDFFKGLINHCPARWMIWSPSSGKLILDPGLSQYLGLKDNEVEVRQFYKCFLPEDAALLENKMLALNEKGEGFDIRIRVEKDRVPCVLLARQTSHFPLASYVLWFREILSPAELSEHALSNKFLMTVFNSLPIPLWCKDKEGRISYCNKFYAETLETTSSAAIKENKTLYTGVMKTQEDGARELTEHTIVNGNRHLLKYKETPISEDIEGYLGYALDETQVERLEKDLERHIAGHAEVLENIATGVIIYDIDKRVSFFNHAFSRMYNIDETWLHSRPTIVEVLDYLHKNHLLAEQADFPAYKQRILQMFKSLIAPLQELHHLPDERTVRKVTAPHPDGGLVIIFEDVTDSLVLQRQANTQMAVQRETLDHLSEGVAVFASDNRLKLINPAFARIWRLSSGYLEPGLHISEIIDQLKPYFEYGDDWEPYKQKIISNITDRIPKNGRLTRTDDIVLEFTYVPLPDGAHLVSYTDVTDSYRAERALRERNEALEAADRVKSEFLHNFSFDLKAPINTIIGFSEILSDKYFGQLNEQQETYCKGILESSNQLLTLVNDIIDLATIEAGQMNLNLQPVEPRTVLNSVASMVRKRIKRQNINLSVSCSSDLGEFIADERRLKQAIINLIHNSIKFTQPGGRISISANKVGQNVHLIISDTGAGISRRDQKRIFRKFERTDQAADRYEGMGLGLSLVKSLIELHGGRIMISSKQKMGTKITCVIPMNLQQTPQPKLPNIA